MMRIPLMNRLLYAHKKILNDKIKPINLLNPKCLLSTCPTRTYIKRFNLYTSQPYTLNIRKIHLCSYERARHGRTRDDVMDDDDPEMARFLADLENDLPGNHNSILTEDDDTSLTRTHREHDRNIDNNREELTNDQLKAELYNNEDFTMDNMSDDLIDQEMKKYGYEDFTTVDLPDHHDAKPSHRQYPISLNRGIEGVYDLGELCSLISAENGRDLCALTVDPSLNYVRHMVIATCRSTRHIRAVAEFIKLLYKKKRSKRDAPTVKIEGIDQSHDWYALDLGNIAVHLFLEDTRAFYDLETLWSVGSEHDDQSIRGQDNMEDPYAISIDDPNFMKDFLPLTEVNKELKERTL